MYKTSNKSKKIIFLAVIFFIIIAAFLIFNKIKYKTLFIIDANSNKEKVIKTYKIKRDGYFSVKFIHSVNKSPVIDYYNFDEDNNIYVYKTVYYGFGAGVQTELNEGESFTYGENGEMIVSSIDKKIDELTYYVGTISDHELEIDDNKKIISLRDLCGKNRHIRFLIK